MKIVIFGGANYNASHTYYKLAYDFGSYIAKNGHTVINGGYGGIMEASAKGAYENGGNTLGITFDYLPFKPNNYIKQAISKPDLLTRTKHLIDIGDVYIAFPGGTGTLLEISMVLEFMNKRVIPSRQFFFATDFWKKVIDSVTPELKFKDPRFADSESHKNIMRLINFIHTPEELML